MAILGALYEVSRKECIQSIDRLSGVFQMKKHLSNLISSYSHGMKQKLALMALAL